MSKPDPNAPKPNPPSPMHLYADIGDVVNWYAGGDPSLTPIVGYVVSKSPGFAPGTSNLTLVLLTGSGMGQKEGVLHMTNDRCRRPGNPNGGWMHRPADLAFKAFMLAVGALTWDGKQDYVFREGFDPLALGAAMNRLMEAKPQEPTPSKEIGNRQTPPPPPPPSPPTVPPA